VNVTDAIEQHYSVKEAAALLTVSVPTMRRWEREAQIKGLRIGGKLVFSESAIREFLEHCAANQKRRVPTEALLRAGGRPRRKGVR
jgi:excisionase family DNA binding protein